MENANINTYFDAIPWIEWGGISDVLAYDFDLDEGDPQIDVAFDLLPSHEEVIGIVKSEGVRSGFKSALDHLHDIVYRLSKENLKSLLR